MTGDAYVHQGATARFGATETIQEPHRCGMGVLELVRLHAGVDTGEGYPAAEVQKQVFGGII